MASLFLIPLHATGEETVVTAINLPGASASQEVTYSTSKADYEAFRDLVLGRLRRGDLSALVNPADGPWMRAETTAQIGFEFRGVGVSSGKKHIRQISAAEEALFIYDREK